ncbi:MAG: aminodeoxychorismate/anthranilate synthase component II [Anaerohalosphaera sp.]|nr:aminodeoxychorismate/anthranilate synthase component II [Anaerohalosphaera sp.]
METPKINVLFIDNFDSFTYNLVDEFGKRNCPTTVYRADTPIEELIKISGDLDPQLIVISPGPGNPDTAGVTLDAIAYFQDKIPIFGVCLGMQSIVQHFGGRIDHAPSVMHGKASKLTHLGKGVFNGLENPLHAGRYHSLCAIENPECLEAIAEFEGIIMGIQHKTLPIHAVQFHPESVLTPTGGKIIENMINIAAQAIL